MARKAAKPFYNPNTDFELDLAPLLAVMVKLVPVLLLSSAFVQVMMIESDLPQAVKEAVENPPKDPETSIQMALSASGGITIFIQSKDKNSSVNVPLKSNAFDYEKLHLELQQVKRAHPEVFRLELKPEANIPYRDLVKAMDEARKSRNKDIKFPVFDKNENKEVMTDYMFPDVVFTNVMEGD
jgi:biopolymer transport protein ExbD